MQGLEEAFVHLVVTGELCSLERQAPERYLDMSLV
jgi:hypothetical protein